MNENITITKISILTGTPHRSPYFYYHLTKNVFWDSKGLDFFITFRTFLRLDHYKAFPPSQTACTHTSLHCFCLPVEQQSAIRPQPHYYNRIPLAYPTDSVLLPLSYPTFCPDLALSAFSKGYRPSIRQWYEIIRSSHRWLGPIHNNKCSHPAMMRASSHNIPP